MSESFSSYARAAILFEEDFDLPTAPAKPPEPEIIEPVFTGAELESARAESWQQGHEAACAEWEASTATAAQQALSAIGAQLDLARDDAAIMAERAAEAIAQLLIDGLATAFPALCARLAEAELLAVIRTVLPALHQEPRITVRVDPDLAPVITKEIERLDPDLAPRVEVIPTEVIARGDIRISWRNGSATRDTGALWAEIADILAPAGLLVPGPSIPRSAMPQPSASRLVPQSSLKEVEYAQ